MPPMYRTLASLVVALLVTLALVGMTFSASHHGRAEFRFINGTEPQTLDPGLMTGAPEGRLAEAVFEGLVRRLARTMEPVPGVAESWEISGDGTTYTFHLRRDAQWNDGTPLDARDFLYSWRRLLDPKLGAEYAYILFPIRHTEALNTAEEKAARLGGSVLHAFDALATSNPNGLSTSQWRAFAREHQLHDLMSVDGDAIARLLAADGLDATRYDAFRRAARDTVRQLRKRHSDAVAHFGVDEGAFAPDPHTLVVQLRAPTPYFLDVVAFYASFPVPRHVVEQPGNAHDWFLPGKLVSNGAFRVAEWIVNDHLRLERSDHYWDRANVALRSIDALSLENVTTNLNLYLTGEVDWLPKFYPEDLVDQLRTRGDFYANPGNSVYYYRLNNDRPPLNDKRVRKALNLAIDRRVITDEVGRLGQIPAASMVPPGVPSYEPPPSAVRLDVAEAQRLLAEAGFPDGRGFPELGILFNTFEMHRKIAEVVADQLRRNLGIRVKAYNQEWQSFLTTTSEQDYDIARSAWNGDYVDPNTFLDMWVTNGGQNQTGFSNATYDQLIAAAADVDAFAREPGDLPSKFRFPATRAALERTRQQGSPSELRRNRETLRLKLFAEAEAILFQDEFPVIPIFFYVVSGLVSPRVRGFYSQLELSDGTRAHNLQDLHPLQDISLLPGGSTP